MKTDSFLLPWNTRDKAAAVPVPAPHGVAWNTCLCVIILGSSIDVWNAAEVRLIFALLKKFVRTWKCGEFCTRFVSNLTDPAESLRGAGRYVKQTGKLVSWKDPRTSRLYLCKTSYRGCTQVSLEITFDVEQKSLFGKALMCPLWTREYSEYWFQRRGQQPNGERWRSRKEKDIVGEVGEKEEEWADGRDQDLAIAGRRTYCGYAYSAGCCAGWQSLPW